MGGIRFKCGNCAAYDVCTNCFVAASHGHKKDHVFLAITRPLHELANTKPLLSRGLYGAGGSWFSKAMAAEERRRNVVLGQRRAKKARARDSGDDDDDASESSEEVRYRVRVCPGVGRPRHMTLTEACEVAATNAAVAAQLRAILDNEKAPDPKSIVKHQVRTSHVGRARHMTLDQMCELAGTNALVSKQLHRLVWGEEDDDEEE